jgi:hypothetical protein
MIWGPTLTALTLLAPASTGGPSPELVHLVQQSCAGCHDARHILNLQALPPQSDKKTWNEMLEMVQSFRMPPAKKSGSPSARFPLDPAVRERLIVAIQRFIGQTEEVPPPHISSQVWSAIVGELASGLIPPQRLEALVGDVGFVMSERILPSEVVFLGHTAQQICSELVRADLRQPPARRRFTSRLEPSGHSAGAPADLVGVLYRAVHGEAPSADELAAGAELFEQVLAETRSRRTAWIALCASYLAGPRLLYLSYVAGD